MGLVLDTDVIIRAERSTAPLDFNRWASYGNAYISAITVSELLIGVYRADSEARRLRRSTFVEAILARVPALPFTGDVARTHAGIVAAPARQGALIGAHDLIIASTALSHGYALLTFNVNEFERVPGLELASF
jgi:tRNA(fMet)-specific endonuclease VapC